MADSTRNCNSMSRNRWQAAVASMPIGPARKSGTDETLHTATPEQRYPMKKAELKQPEMAAVVCVDKSTLSRELHRNGGLKGYRPKQAHQLAMIRRQTKAQPRVID